MLCRINPNVGGVTDERARAINFLRAIQAICTAAANTTPSVPSQTGASVSPSGTDVILEVISNSEAGGWSNSSSTNVITNYDVSFGSPYQVDLYRDSGKGVYPYRKMSFRTNPFYSFGSSYTSYPYILASHGFNGTTDASGNYLLGTTQSMISADGATDATNAYRFDVNYVDNDTNAMGNHGHLRPNAGEWLIASTSQYFIAMCGSTNPASGCFMYIGLRTTNAWESQYDDNPPLVSLAYDGSNYYTNGAGCNASMYARTMSSTGQVNSLPSWYRIRNTGYNGFTNAIQTDGVYIDPLSGYNNDSNFKTNVTSYMMNDSRYYWGNQMQVPMLPGMTMMRSKTRSGSYTVTSPVTDTSTGTFVPPAYPITFARNVQSSFNPGGTAIGVYKSLGGTEAYLQQYYTTGQTFILNNEAYYPYSIGSSNTYRDLFLIRKA